jgi:hypothetical protein
MVDDLSNTLVVPTKPESSRVSTVHGDVDLSERLVDYSRWLLTAIVVLSAGYIVTSTLRAVWVAHFKFPYMDEWAFVGDAANFRLSNWWGFLWHQHNEHRIALTRLVLGIDLLLFRYRGTFPIAVILSIQTLQVILFSYVYWTTVQCPASVKVAYSALITGLMFSATQMENFVWPFQVGFAAVFCAAAIAILSLIKHCRTKHHKAGYLSLSISSGVCTTGSLSNGLFIWPTMLLIALTERARASTIIGVTTVGGLMTFLYLRGYSSPSHHANPLQSILHPVAILSYMAVYLTNPIGGRIATACALIGFGALLAAVIFRAQLKLGDFWHSSAFFWYFALFALITPFITSLGRMNFGLQQATASRYATPALTFWASIFSIGMIGLSRLPNRLLGSFSSIMFALLVFPLILLPRQKPFTASYVELGRAVNVAGIALMVDVPGDNAFRELYPNPAIPRAYLPFLREHRLSLFADPMFEMQGHPVPHGLNPTTSDHCLGSFDSATAIAGSPNRSFKVAGWAWQMQPPRGVEKVLLVDDYGGVVGFALGGGARGDVAKFFRAHKMAETGWDGYANLARDSRALTAYGFLDSDRGLCQIGQIKLNLR